MFTMVDQVSSKRVGRGLALTGIATLVVLLGIAAYVYLNRVPPTVAGELASVSLYQPQLRSTDTTLTTAVQSGNTLLLLVPIKIHNLSAKPLSVMDLFGVIKLGDTDYKSYAASPIDFDKVFHYYPDLDAYKQPALPRHVEIPPGGESQGLVIFNYALAEDQWNHAKSFQVDVSFDTTPYILHLNWLKFPAHNEIAATSTPIPTVATP